MGSTNKITTQQQALWFITTWQICRMNLFLQWTVITSSYFYSKTNHMHNISNLFYFGTTLYMFRTVSPSIIRSLRLYIQHQVYVIQVLWLLASGNISFPLASSHRTCVIYIWYCMYSLRLLIWMERPSKTCRVLFQNKTNLRYCTCGWFYYRNILRCTVLQTSKYCQLVQHLGSRSFTTEVCMSQPQHIQLSM